MMARVELGFSLASGEAISRLGVLRGCVENSEGWTDLLLSADRGLSVEWNVSGFNMTIPLPVAEEIASFFLMTYFQNGELLGVSRKYPEISKLAARVSILQGADDLHEEPSEIKIWIDGTEHVTVELLEGNSSVRIADDLAAAVAIEIARVIGNHRLASAPVLDLPSDSSIP